MQRNNEKIFIFTYSKKIYCKKKNIYFPLEVGAANRDALHRPIYPFTDEKNDNNSFMNPVFGELTGLYWAWKNNNSQYVGFYHYNKYLKISVRKSQKFLKSNNGFIVAKKMKMKNHSNPEQYSTFLKVLKKYDYNFYLTYCNYISNFGCGYISPCNMFITTRENLNKYCSFLFPLLDEIYKAIGITDNDKSIQRYCAFFAERLLTPYIEYNKIPYKEVPIKYIGPFYYRILVKIFFLISPLLSETVREYLFRRFVKRSSYK